MQSNDNNNNCKVEQLAYLAVNGWVDEEELRQKLTDEEYQLALEVVYENGGFGSHC